MKILCLFILTLSTFADDKLFSQSVNLDRPSAAFTEISTALSKTTALKSTFKQLKKIKALKRPLKSSGELIFSNKLGVFWHLQKPYQSTIIINDNKMTSIDDQDKKVTFTAAEKPILYNFTRIFMSIFTGKTTELQKHFKLYFTGNKKSWKIGLTPKSHHLKKVITKIILQGDGVLLKALTIIEANGDETAISFAEIKIDALSKEDLQKFAF